MRRVFSVSRQIAVRGGGFSSISTLQSHPPWRRVVQNYSALKMFEIGTRIVIGFSASEVVADSRRKCDLYPREEGEKCLEHCIGGELNKNHAN